MRIAYNFSQMIDFPLGLKAEQDLTKDGVKYKVGQFLFLANSRAKTNLDTEGQVKFLVEEESDRILGVHIIGASSMLPLDGRQLRTYLI